MSAAPVEVEIARLQKLVDDWDISGAVRTSAYWRLVSELERRHKQLSDQSGQLEPRGEA